MSALSGHSRAFLERLEVIKEMKASPWHPRVGELDWTPPLELIGVFTAYSTVAKMVHDGELEPAAGLYLNSALAINAFCVIHHCSHESVSQHNPDHAALENTAFRLGTVLLFIMNEGFREGHKMHHLHLGTPLDPDLPMERASLPELGFGMFQSFAEPDYSAANWDHMVLKLAVIEARKIIKQRSEYAKLHRTVQATYTGANQMSVVVGQLMFSRYVHRHSPVGDELESFYDGTFRSQGDVDLWMMGEGPHHLHHAKPDVAYSWLPKICQDLE